MAIRIIGHQPASHPAERRGRSEAPWARRPAADAALVVLDDGYLRDESDLLFWSGMRQVRVASLPDSFSNCDLVDAWDERFDDYRAGSGALR